MLMVFFMSTAPISKRYISPEELAAYRVFAAYLVAEFGAKYIAVLDRVEKDLEVALRVDPIERARRILESAIRPAQTVSGGRKAISFSQ
jgi:DNA-binding SARP family transcriptional activator